MKANGHDGMSRRNFVRLLGAGALAGPLGAGCARLRPAAAPDWPAQGEFFSLVVLPDTQCYADTRLKESAAHWGRDLREHFFAQTRWIRRNRKRLKIAMVAHVGDIVQTDYAEEWEIASKAFRALDGAVPYCLSLGNHDLGYRFTGDDEHPRRYATAETRATLYNHYFPPSRFRKLAHCSYGGNLGGRSDNHYLMFEAGGMNFFILALEVNPRDEVLQWANGVARLHPYSRGIVVTHAYLNPGGRRAAQLKYRAPGNGPQAIWDKFVRRQRNIFMVLCGHYGGEAHQVSAGLAGNPVYELLADYQALDDGGAGYLRVMTFYPFEDRIDVRTYSPSLDKFMTGPRSQFALEYRMRARRNEISAA